MSEPIHISVPRHKSKSCKIGQKKFSFEWRLISQEMKTKPDWSLHGSLHLRFSLHLLQVLFVLSYYLVKKLRNQYCHLLHYITGLAITDNGVSSGLPGMSRHGLHFFSLNCRRWRFNGWGWGLWRLKPPPPESLRPCLSPVMKGIPMCKDIHLLW